MTEEIFFGFKMGTAHVVCKNLKWYPAVQADITFFYKAYLDGVVSQEIDFFYRKQLKNFNCYPKITVVCRQSQFQVSLHCVHAFFLQRVCLQFINYAYISAFLAEIYYDASVNLDILHSGVQLLPTLALSGMKNFAGNAF